MSRFPVDEENDPRADGLSAWLREIKRELEKEGDEAVTYAKTQLRAELKARGSTADTVLTNFLVGIYATAWVLKKMKPLQQAKLMRALGCQPDTEKPILELINSAWPQPSDKELRKRVKNRHSRYHRALQGALREGIKPPKLAEAFRTHGGVEGWAKVARSERAKAAREGEQREPEGSGSKPAKASKSASAKLRDHLGKAAKSPGAAQRSKKGKMAGLGAPDDGRHGRNGHGDAEGAPSVQVEVSERAARRLSREKVCIGFFHGSEEGVVTVSGVVAAPGHKEEDDEALLDEIIRVVLMR